MQKFSRFRIGDTLIEVALAIGIFSMVAIAVVSVVSGSSSSTQAALETTITREEIDSQAEALRFIHASYNAGGEVGGSEANRYKSIWKEITKDAIDLTDSGYGESIKNIIMNYSPSNCAELYDTGGGDELSVVKQHAFIINTRALSNGSASDVIIRPSNGSGSKLRAAATYPRLIYEDDSDALLGGESNKLQYAEGIYIVAVKDPDSTVVISDDGKGGSVQKISAYYDFYIHTCWFNPNEEQPSTISTVVRLYDPDTISSNEYSRSVVTIKYDGNGATSGSMAPQYILSGKSASLIPNKYKRTGREFMGWDANNDGKVDYKDGDTYEAEAGLKENKTVTLKAVWGYIYTLNYRNTNDNTYKCTDTKVSETLTPQTFNIIDCMPDDPNPNTDNKTFQGWSRFENGSGNIYDNDIDGTERTITVSDLTTTLYPVWRKIITFDNSNWTPSNESALSDCWVFHVKKPDGVTCSVDSTRCKPIAGGTRWDGGNGRSIDNSGYAIAPLNGYLVLGGSNIELYDDGINLQGKCYSRLGDTYVSYDINANDTFELEASLNTANVLTHPGGSAYVSIGPVSMTINSGTYYQYKCSSGSSGSGTFSSRNPKIKLTKYGSQYSLYVDNNNVISGCSKNESSVTVKYGMSHDSHSCGKLFNIQLTGIKMKQEVIE